jgi:hypothetical protein
MRKTVMVILAAAALAVIWVVVAVDWDRGPASVPASVPVLPATHRKAGSGTAPSCAAGGFDFEYTPRDGSTRCATYYQVRDERLYIMILGHLGDWIANNDMPLRPGDRRLALDEISRLSPNVSIGCSALLADDCIYPGQRDEWAKSVKRLRPVHLFESR